MAMQRGNRHGRRYGGLKPLILAMLSAGVLHGQTKKLAYELSGSRIWAAETAFAATQPRKDNVPERSKLFEDYLFIERSRSSNDSDISEEQRIENPKELEEVRCNYHPSKPTSWCWKIVSSPNTRKGVPDNPTFRDLRKHIGHPEYNDLIYGGLSAAIHPVPSYEMWLRRADGSMELGSHFGPQIGSVAQLTLALAGDSIVDVIRFLKPEDEKQLCVCVMVVLLRREQAAANPTA